MFKKTLIFSFLLLSIFLFSSHKIANHIKEPDLKYYHLLESGKIYNIPSFFSTPWIDSVYNSLSLEERIAQLLMIRVHTDQNESYYSGIENIVRKYNVGGLAFFRGGPERQLKLTNRLQKAAKTPMLIAMDAEWGLAMRLDSTISFPMQMTLGAIRDERLIYEMGLNIGYQAKRMGVHINFAPVIDVNNNPKNPVINFRSFGECRYNVARKGLAYMRGMQDAGIIACAKHFPGHGDTDSDSHYTLPVIKHPFEVLDSIHIYPFKQLIDHGLLSVMVAHLNIPALDRRRNMPSTLSPNIVNNLLRNDLGFNGLIITDALDMKGVTKYYKPGEIELEALKAGNDILLLPQDVDAAIKAISEAVEQGSLSEKYLEQKVKKVLLYKHAVGLNKYKPIPVRNLYEHLNSTQSKALNRRLARASITLMKNEDSIIPIKNLNNAKIASLSIGSPVDNAFQSMLKNYYPVSMYSIGKTPANDQINLILNKLRNYDLVIISVHNNSYSVSRNYGISQQTIDIIDKISEQNNAVLNLFASPYTIDFLSRKSIINLKSIIISYQDGLDFEDASAQIIFGGLPARGRLPVSVPPYASVYQGLQTPSSFRVRFGTPEDVGINSDNLKNIDSIALSGIEQKAFPGCQIVFIKNGVVFYNKSFGHHTYNGNSAVKDSDIYDLASITKIAATTLAIMKLVDEGKLDINKSLAHYLTWLKDTNFAGIEIREILAHQAMLRSWIPFYINTLENNLPSAKIYQSKYSEEFPIEVTKNLFIHRSFKDSIFSIILETPLLEEKRYVYSDLGFILMAELIEKITGETIDSYVLNEFYKPLGLKTLRYHPIKKFDLKRIVPSENDQEFRKQILQGYVNDPAAAMLGGVSGHAGLFGNALELAILMEMINRSGEYAGIQFIAPNTIKEFTTVQFAEFENRRGLGFDKPSHSAKQPSPACENASLSSFGHSGFTGTYTWVDPEENLVYVFVSNRTFPNANNRKINELEIRSSIHQAIYDAILSSRFIDQAVYP